jgi:two-component system response regulator AtoC
MDIAILILEENKREKGLIRTLLGKFPAPIRFVEPEDIESGRSDVDVVILGLSRGPAAQQRLDEQLVRVRAASPRAQLILLAPRTLKDLEDNILKYQARSLLLKPLNEKTFSALFEKVLQPLQRRKEREGYNRRSQKASCINDIIGTSEAIQQILSLLARVSESESTSVLLLGETGTGKSLFAQYIHELSDRSDRPFIEINCAALPEALMESELFGHEPGAFTDATTQKIGLIELADHSTLFFDEVTEIGLQTQAKLLKFLDSKKIRRLGGDAEIEVDTRIIAASNRILKDEVRRGKFRADLFYRLNVVEIQIPPLRERKTDTRMIAEHYFEEFKRKFNKRHLTFDDDALDLLREYTWPGNVRELINVIERAVLLCTGKTIRREDLPIQQNPGHKSVALTSDVDDLIVQIPPGGISLETLEKKVIEEMLKRSGGNVLKAARQLSVTRGTLRYKLVKYGIDPRQYQRKALVLT